MQSSTPDFSQEYCNSIGRAVAGNEARLLLPPQLNGTPNLAKPPVTHLKLRAGEKTETTLQLTAADVSVGAGAFVAWEFWTKSRNIGFAVVGPGGATIIPLRTAESHKYAVKGCTWAVSAGSYRLVWSNEASRMRGKTLSYRAYVVRQPRMCLGEEKSSQASAAAATTAPAAPLLPPTPPGAVVSPPAPPAADADGSDADTFVSAEEEEKDGEVDGAQHHPPLRGFTGGK